MIEAHEVNRTTVPGPQELDQERERYDLVIEAHEVNRMTVPGPQELDPEREI